MSEHLDQDGLADVLAAEPAPGFLQHLELCWDCRAALAELRSALDRVGGVLAALPAPTSPAGLADRLETTVADERQRLATAAAAGSASATRPAALSARRHVKPRRWVGGLPAAAAAAAAAAVVIGGVLLTQQGSNHPTGSPAAGRGAQDPTGDIAINNTGTAYGTDRAALAAELPTLLSGKPFKPLRAQGTGAASTTTGGSDRSPALLAAPAPDPLTALRQNAPLAACLSSLSDPNDPRLPLAVDYGSYAGTPALVVVLAAPVKDKLDVYFVGAACSASDAHVLLFDRVSRP